MQSRLDLDDTKFTQDRPPAQSVLLLHTTWPFSLPDQDCKQLTPLHFIPDMLVSGRFRAEQAKKHAEQR